MTKQLAAIETYALAKRRLPTDAASSFLGFGGDVTPSLQILALNKLVSQLERLAKLDAEKAELLSEVNGLRQQVSGLTTLNQKLSAILDRTHKLTRELVEQSEALTGALSTQIQSTPEVRMAAKTSIAAAEALRVQVEALQTRL
ncbi:MAG: hypothetical protein AAFX02_05310 [Pseudomonadota bacterium]